MAHIIRSVLSNNDEEKKNAIHNIDDIISSDDSDADCTSEEDDKDDKIDMLNEQQEELDYVIETIDNHVELMNDTINEYNAFCDMSPYDQLQIQLENEWKLNQANLLNKVICLSHFIY